MARKRANKTAKFGPNVSFCSDGKTGDFALDVKAFGLNVQAQGNTKKLRISKLLSHMPVIGKMVGGLGDAAPTPSAEPTDAEILARFKTRDTYVAYLSQRIYAFNAQQAQDKAAFDAQMGKACERGSVLYPEPKAKPAAKKS